ncbi:hypothetical protein CEXT_694791 [Caerostris extrusa]|uniref:Uncharacterized protein n=1 Tax=Caerostris extrusa TaxID=172846 RepID=A0AAV4QCH0_CAEEX|nr:hypothetical protein CEXT_694791 [Caerostris extrusa]
MAGVKNNKRKEERRGEQAPGWKCLQGPKHNTVTPSDCSAAPPTRKKFGPSSPSHFYLMVFYRSSPWCLL